jgi:dTDP-4-dehydrorhamnose 3,5-epimerase
MKIKSHPKNKDIVLLTPQKFNDERGYFTEIYRKNFFDNLPPIWYKAEGDVTKKSWPPQNDFVQDNLVVSKKNVVRGLHFQKNHPQGKFVRCISGTILDVVVDLRPNCDTYKQWISVELSEENGVSLWVPEGFAHGYSVLSDEAVVLYKCTDVWHPGDEGGIIWNDDTLNIDWKVSEEDAIISEKDLKLNKLGE